MNPTHSYAPTAGAPGHPYAQAQQPFDTTGQVAPPGMKPRVTATLWEDEGSLCFQVEAKGVCVARREGKQNKRSPHKVNQADIMSQITTLSTEPSY